MTEDDFMNAKQELVPSVSVDELRHYERVRDTFEGATKRPRPDEEDSKTHKQDGFQNGNKSPQKRVEFMKHTNGSRDKVPTANGSKRFQSIINQAAGGASDADDDYVVRTDRLLLNNAAVKPPSKGKGKVKIPGFPVADGDANANEADDLYD